MQADNFAGFDRETFERLVTRKIDSKVVLWPFAGFDTVEMGANPAIHPFSARSAQISGKEPAVSDQVHSVTPPSLIFPGAFNPIHEAHLEMAGLAHTRYPIPLWFEISVLNADKGSLTFDDALFRTVQTYGPYGLVLTSATTFAEKSELFPGAIFVVGADTIRRVADLKYYDHCRKKFNAALGTLRRNKCRFLVFARKIGDKLYTKSNCELSPDLMQICEFVPAEEFQLDCSSSQIRIEKKY